MAATYTNILRFAQSSRTLNWNKTPTVLSNEPNLGFV